MLCKWFGFVAQTELLTAAAHGTDQQSFTVLLYVSAVQQDHRARTVNAASWL